MRWFKKEKKPQTNIDKELSEKFCLRFGIIAVEMGFVTSQQLKSALAEQVDDEISGRPHRLIGKILFEHGWITPDQIDRVMNQLYKEKGKLGQ
jgi:hypothetical protein